MSVTESRLEMLFGAVSEKFELLRRQNSQIDGQKLWQPIKNLLEPLDKVSPVGCQFKPISQTLTDKIMNLPESFKNGYGIEKMIEINHFLIQQVRIPLKEQVTVRKVIQIALNIGQWKGSPNPNIEIHDSEKLDKIERYLTKKDIDELSKIISNDIFVNVMDYLKSL
jgi:hypothetical protein